MGLLDEAGLDRLVNAGCAACGGRKLIFRTYVDGAFPFLAAEPVGRPTWAYDGEKFVDGVYAADCAGCGAALFAADVCPRCHAPGGLATALATENGWPVPAVCGDADCGGEEYPLPGVRPRERQLRRHARGSAARRRRAARPGLPRLSRRLPRLRADHRGARRRGRLPALRGARPAARASRLTPQARPRDPRRET